MRHLQQFSMLNDTEPVSMGSPWCPLVDSDISTSRPMENRILKHRSCEVRNL